MANPLMAMPFATPLIGSLFGTQQVGPAAPAFNMGGGPAMANLSTQVAGGGLPTLLSQTMPEMGPPAPVDDAVEDVEQKGFFDKFFSNLDTNLQSPSKVIGLGLLNRLDPRLAGAGLLAGGFLGPNSFTR